MIADFEYRFSQHEETIRRAEVNARLLAALTPEQSPRPEKRPTERLTTLLRRLAGTAASA
jgi:hypothetical protein